MAKARAPKKEKSAEEQAAEAAAKAEKLKADVEALIQDALKMLASGEAKGIKLQSTKDERDGLFPSGSAGPVKEAVRLVKSGEDSRIGRVVAEGGGDLFGLTVDGIESVTKTLPPAEAAKLLDDFMARQPESLPKLLPVRERVKTELVREAKEQEKRQAEREESRRRILAAIEQQKKLLLEERDEVVASLRRQLRALGADTASPGGAVTPLEPQSPPAELNRLRDEVSRLTGELRAAKAVASGQTNIAPEDSQEFVRNVARRLVGVWTEAVDKGNDAARNAIEVAISNVGAIAGIGEDGDVAEYDPQRHEPTGPVDPGDPVVIERPGWVLAEQAGVEYVIQKARVERGG